MPDVLPLPPSRSGITVREVASVYLDHLRARVQAGDYSADAFVGTRRELTRFADKYGKQLVSECRRQDLTSWLNANPQWNSNHTKRRVLSSILAAFRWADDEGIISVNPYRRPRLRLTVRPRRPARIPEYVSLMRHGRRPLRRALFFLRRTGARTCEMRQALWADVDWDLGIVRLDDHKTVDAMAGQPRLIGLDPAVLRFLRNLHRRRPAEGLVCHCEFAEGRPHRTNDHVFLNERHVPWDRHTLARNLRRVADRIGLAPDVTAYCLRHMFAADAIEAGVGERQLADQLGHTTTRMVSWYARQSRQRAEHLRNVAGQVARRKKDD